MIVLDTYSSILTEMGFHVERTYQRYKNTFNDVTVYSNRWKGLFDIDENSQDGCCYITMWVPIEDKNIKKVLTRFNLEYIAFIKDKYDTVFKIFKMTLRD